MYLQRERERERNIKGAEIMRWMRDEMSSGRKRNVIQSKNLLFFFKCHRQNVVIWWKMQQQQLERLN